MIRRHLLIPALACSIYAADPASAGGGGSDRHIQEAATAYERMAGDIDPNVINGRMYIKATVDLKGIKRIVVDDTMKIARRDRNDAGIAAYRYLSFGGHPGKKMDFRSLKPEGIAYKKEGDDLLIRDYISWTSMEGGAGITAVVIIPNWITLEKRVFRKPNEGGGVDLNDELNNYWAPLSKEGYKKISFELDPKRAAKDMAEK